MLSTRSSKAIRVVTVRRDLLDPPLASPEELAAACNAIFASGPPGARPPGSADAVLALAALLRGPYGPLLGPPDPAWLPEIALRALLVNTAVRPVVMTHPSALTVRAPACLQAFDGAGRPIAFAAEDPMAVVGLAFDARGRGRALAAALVAPRNFGATACAASGAFSAPLFAIECDADSPTESVDAGSPEFASLTERLRQRKFTFAQLGPATIRAALAQSAAAADYYLSGAAAAVGAAALRSALRQQKYANPELAAAFHGAGLQMHIISVSATPEPVGDRLRYLLDQLGGGYGADTDGARHLNNLNALRQAGAFDAYYFVLTGGRESAQVAAIIEQARMQTAMATAAAATAAAAAVAASRAQLLVVVVEEKLGIARLRALISGLGAQVRGAPGGRLAAFSAIGTALSDPNAVLAELTPKERTLVEVAAAARVAAAAAVANNKCAHVQAARRLRTARSAAQALAALAELTPFLSNTLKTNGTNSLKMNGTNTLEIKKTKEVNSMITCRHCSQNALCPHVRDRVELEARGASYGEVRSRLEKYALRTGGDAAAYYCRLCAEQLAVADSVNDEEGRAAAALGRFGELGAGLRTRIWALALASVRHVRFTVPADERAFARTAADAVTPLLEAAIAADAPARRANARRPRRAAAGAPSADELRDELEPRTELRAALYVYAFLLDRLQRAPGAFAGGPAGERPSATAERMLQRAAAEQHARIAQLEDVSMEYLRDQFTAAYKAVRGAGAGASAGDPATTFVSTVTTIDPIYRYATTVARAVGDLPVWPPTDPAGARQEFERVLGAPLPTLLQSARDAARDPALAALFAGRPGLEVPAGTSFEYWLKDPRVTLYNDVYMFGDSPDRTVDIKEFYRGVANDDPAARAAVAKTVRFWLGGEARAKRTLQRARPAWAKNAPVNPNWAPVHDLRAHAAERGAFFEAWRLFVMYSTTVTSPAAEAAYKTELARYRDAEDALRTSHAYSMARPTVPAEKLAEKRAGLSQRFVATAVSITQLYDELGAPHDWSRKATFFFASDNKSDTKSDTKSDNKSALLEIEVKGGARGVMAAREAGTLPADARLVDVACATCGVRRSEVQTLNAKRTAASVRALSELAAFFMYYESRCPVRNAETSGVHEWVEGRCVCGLEVAVAMATAGSSAAIAAARRAYYDKYSAEFSRARQAAAHDMYTQPDNVGELAPGPSDRHRPAADASPWISNYSLVVEAAALAATTPAVIEAIGAAAGREFADIVEGRGAPPPPEKMSDPRIYVADAAVRALLADYGALRNGAPSAALRNGAPSAAPLDTSSLPNIGDAYCAEFAEMRRARSPADVLAFAIESVCKYSLQIAKSSPIGEDVAKRALDNVVRGVRRLSKPGPFDWSVFNGDRERVDEEAQVPDQVGDVGEDVVVRGADPDAAPSSSRNIDYEAEDNPNEEPP